MVKSLCVRKKVFIIAGDLDPNRLGGAEKHVVETLPWLAQKNYEFHLFVGSQDNIKILYEKHPNIVVHPINYPAIQNLFSLSYVIFAIPHLYRFLKKNKIDLIWSKEVFPMGIVAAVLKKIYKLPLYGTTQNPYCYKEEMIIVSKRLPRFVKNIIQNALTPLVSWAIRQTDYMGAVSAYSQNLAYKMGAKKCDVIPNGIELSNFPLKKTVPHIKNSRQVKIISTSSFIPRNGIDILIRALALLPNKERYRLSLTSTGPLLDDLKRLTKELKIENLVAFLGVQPPGMIPKLLAESDIFIRPSRAEGFGVSFIEAMAIGTPVITCPSGGIVDFVTDKKTGLLVPPENPEAVRDAILELTQDEELYKKLVKNGRKIVEDRYAWERIANQIDRIWAKMLVS